MFNFCLKPKKRRMPVYKKINRLNGGIRAGMTAQDQPHETLDVDPFLDASMCIL